MNAAFCEQRECNVSPGKCTVLDTFLDQKTCNQDTSTDLFALHKDFFKLKNHNFSALRTSVRHRAEQQAPDFFRFSMARFLNSVNCNQTLYGQYHPVLSHLKRHHLLFWNQFPPNKGKNRALYCNVHAQVARYSETSVARNKAHATEDKVHDVASCQ